MSFSLSGALLGLAFWIAEQAVLCRTCMMICVMSMQAKQSAEEVVRRAQGEAAAAREHAKRLAKQWREAGFEALDKTQAAAKEALEKVR